MSSTFLVYDTTKKIKEYTATEEEAYDVIKKYLKDINFDSYYYRQSFLDDGSIWVDYGSYTHFFCIKEIKGDVTDIINL
jgi:hypothetical protein